MARVFPIQNEKKKDFYELYFLTESLTPPWNTTLSQILSGNGVGDTSEQRNRSPILAMWACVICGPWANRPNRPNPITVWKQK